ncbi:unnamed protein product [Penicillium discolor]
MLGEVRAYRLRELRERLGLSQAQLAERIGVGQRQVSKIENGDLDSARIGTRRWRAGRARPATVSRGGERAIQQRTRRPGARPDDSDADGDDGRDRHQRERCDDQRDAHQREHEHGSAQRGSHRRHQQRRHDRATTRAVHGLDGHAQVVQALVQVALVEHVRGLIHADGGGHHEERADEGDDEPGADVLRERDAGGIVARPDRVEERDAGAREDGHEARHRDAADLTPGCFRRVENEASGEQPLRALRPPELAPRRDLQHPRTEQIEDAQREREHRGEHGDRRHDPADHREDLDEHERDGDARDCDDGADPVHARRRRARADAERRDHDATQPHDGASRGEQQDAAHDGGDHHRGENDRGQAERLAAERYQTDERTQGQVAPDTDDGAGGGDEDRLDHRGRRHTTRGHPEQPQRG